MFSQSIIFLICSTITQASKRNSTTALDINMLVNIKFEDKYVDCEAGCVNNPLRGENKGKREGKDQL